MSEETENINSDDNNVEEQITEAQVPEEINNENTESNEPENSGENTGDSGESNGTDDSSNTDTSNNTAQVIKIDINDESIVKFSDTDLFVDFSKITGLKPNTTYIMSIDNGAIISASGVAVAKFNPIVFTTGT